MPWSPTTYRSFTRRFRAGHVVARFVIDSTGLADLRTLTIEDSPDTALARAVRSYLPQTHFIPAELHGCKVRVWRAGRSVF
jgi:hypothetical protein